MIRIATVALLAAALPGIAGWGPREAATAWVFAAAGLGAGQGVAAAVVFGVIVLAASLPGALVLVGAWIPRPRTLRRVETPLPGRVPVVVHRDGAADA